MKDNEHIITCGKDKKVKVYNWITEKQVANLVSHSLTVNSIVLSPDQNYLFSGAEDKKIIMWHTARWTELCVLNSPFPAYTL